MTKIWAIVVQRCHESVIGGAEAHALELAMRLTKEAHKWVDIITTTAKDYVTWQPYYAEGATYRDGLCVRRFHVARQRFPLLFSAYNFFFLGLKKIGVSFACLERCWFILQGPYCPKMLSFLSSHHHAYERFCFFTYLYYPTVYGVRCVSEASKIVLVPTTHEEAALYFNAVKQVFLKVGRVFANTKEEAALIARTFHVTSHVVGVGCDLKSLPAFEDALGVRILQTYGLKSGSYILYLGRLSKGKGVDVLCCYYSTLDGTWPLVVAGIPERSIARQLARIQARVLPHVSEKEKFFLLKNAACVVNPSAKESLSLLVLESLMCQVPVLVNRHSAVLADYAEHLPSVFGYGSEKEFTSKMNFIKSDAWSAQKKEALLQSYRWVQTTKSWHNILTYFE